MSFFNFKKLGAALLLSAALAVSGVVVVGCGDNGANNEQKDGEKVLGGDPVGDWKPYSVARDGKVEYMDEPDWVGILSLTSSRDFVETTFRKLPGKNFWIEGVGSGGTKWYTQGTTLCLYDENGKHDQECVQFGASGDKFYVYTEYTDCDWDSEKQQDVNCRKVNRTYTYTKANLASVRSSLGTVYKADPALRGDWTLPGSGECYYDEYYDYEYCDQDDYIDFYSTGVYGSGLRRYLGEIDGYGYYDGYYYTIGNTLYLIAEYCEWDDITYDRACTIGDAVPLSYRITGTGDNRTLRIGDDVWVVHIYNYDYDYAPAKSKQGKSSPSRARAKKSAFEPLSFSKKR